MRFRLSAFVLLLLIGLLTLGAPAAQDNLRVGILLDGPFDRNQDVTANIMRTARAALEGTRNVTFPDASRITGDWTGSAAKAGLDRLLRDDGVDVIFTLGVLGSHEAASRSRLSKPVIAPYIVEPEWLKVPSSTRGESFSQQYRVSGVRNLAYVTQVGVSLVDTFALFQQVTPFKKVVVLAAEPIRELVSDMEGDLKKQMEPLGLDEINVIYVKDSLAAPLRAIPDDVGAAIVTQLPQMEATEFQKLASTLVEMKIPAYTTGTRREVELGMLAGVVAPKVDDQVAQRVAELLKQIADGKNAADLPTELAVEESLSFNSGVAAALGIVSDDGTLKTAVRVPGTADGREPAMKPVDVTTMNSAADVDQEEVQRIAMEVNRGIARIPEYSAFDAISASVRGRTVVLLGWAWRPSTAASAERIAQRTNGVETVENHIEVLPTSNNDDRLRGEIFGKIYSQPTMQRYLQGGGLSRFDIQRTLQDLRFGLENVQIVRGPQAVHILVRGGHVALMGNVQTTLQRQVAEQQAQTTAGVFSVENHINVAGG